ncbi:MAG: hypothetical protein GF344_02345 [Chitinivibrionales bacterium]|nr:hypothetical protein [Chitinivibrionales bacterium]MBD3355932.1 hypothetical protein [Chitinivibrionales bacterium]
MSTMFVLKKTIAPFLHPLPLFLSVGALGIAFLLFSKRQKAGKALVVISLLMTALVSQRVGANFLLAPIEHGYTPFNLTAANSPSSIDNGTIDYVVVLGAGHTDAPHFPYTVQIRASALFRLVEGIRIHRRFPSGRLLLSGGHPFGGTPNAEIMAGVARDLGLHDSVMVLETKSKDTHDQARLLRPLLHDKRFVLVTEASHMPRSVALFKKQGLDPIPAPVQFRTLADTIRIPGATLPSSLQLRKSERAFYEWMGLLWAWLRGQV